MLCPLALSGSDFDIIDEALHYFKANVFFRNYEIKVSASSLSSFTVIRLLSQYRSIDRRGLLKELEIAFVW